MDNVAHRLWLSGMADGDDLTATTIQAVLTLCERAPTLPPSVLGIHLPLRDEIYLLPDIWGRCIGVLETLMARNIETLVQCRLGVSRAPTLVAGYLLLQGQTQPATALAALQQRRPRVNPHPETWRSLLDWYSNVKYKH